MRRLKHSPELVAWGEAFYSEELGTEWVSESIYPLYMPSGINIIEACALPAGQYLLKTFYYLPDDSIYIGSREFSILDEMLNGGYYNADGFYESFNGEMVISSVSRWIYPDTDEVVATIQVDMQGPGEDEEGSMTYKLWRIA